MLEAGGFKFDFEQAATIADNWHGSIIVADLKGIILYANARAEELFELPLEKIIGAKVHDIATNPHVTRLLFHLLQETDYIGVSFCANNRHANISLGLVRDKGGSPAFTVGCHYGDSIRALIGPSIDIGSHKLLTQPEVAEELRISKDALGKWVRSGFIPHIRIGNNVRFTRAMIDVFLAERTICEAETEGD